MKVQKKVNIFRELISFNIFKKLILFFLFFGCASSTEVKKSNPNPNHVYSLEEKEKYEDPIFNTYGEIKNSTLCIENFDSYIKGIKTEKQTEYTIYLIDQSGSMALSFEKTTRMEYAKAKLIDVINELKEDSQTKKVKNFGVYSFGASFCNCIDEIQSPFQEFAKEEVISKVSLIQPFGGTPIYNSIEIMSKILKPLEGKFNLVVLTDGADSCGGNASVIKNILAIQNVNLTIDTEIIGIDLDGSTISFYKPIAEEIKAKFRNEEPETSPISLEDYMKEINQYPRNCKYSSMPSRVISSCSEQNITFDFNSRENIDLYYFELMNSGNLTDRRKSYSYYQENCKTITPFREALKTKLKVKEIYELEKKEIQNALNYCKGEKEVKFVNYTQTGFYFNSQYPEGSGDLVLTYKNDNIAPEKVEYEIISESGDLYTTSSSNRFIYHIPPDSTLDKRMPLTLIGNQNVGLKILEKSSVGMKEYKMNGYIDAKEKGFAPKSIPVGKLYPVYYFSENENLNLKAHVFQQGKKTILNSSKMNLHGKLADVFLYKAEMDLFGFVGEIEVQIEKF